MLNNLLQGKPKVKIKGRHWKDVVHEIIFEADTREGFIFDVAILVLIVLSIIVVMLESVPSIAAEHKQMFFILEWIFTIIFTIEYILRIAIVHSPRKYIFSFFGIIDLLSILPAFISIFIEGTQSLLVIRALRLMRIFRVFKMVNHLQHGMVIIRALQNSIQKIIIFISFILVAVTILGSLMYLVESGPDSPFDSIPRSVYWAIVTLTTVGYGDISPHTNLGQFLAAIVMLLGYAVIAVPTGIVGASFVEESKKGITTQSCINCSREGHDPDAEFCKFCGYEIS